MGEIFKTTFCAIALSLSLMYSEINWICVTSLHLCFPINLAIIYHINWWNLLSSCKYIHWCTHKPHIHQPMRIHGQKLTSFCQKLNQTTPLIYMVPTKMNTNINLSILNLPPTSSCLPTYFIRFLISKTIQNLPHLVLIKPTQCPPHIQLIYHFQNHAILYRLLHIPNPFGSI